MDHFTVVMLKIVVHTDATVTYDGDAILSAKAC